MNLPNYDSWKLSDPESERERREHLRRRYEREDELADEMLERKRDEED